MGETFKLNFVTNGEGIVVIDEPTGFDAADFTLKQDDKRLARDVSFAGGESEFKFYRHRNHYIDTLFYYYETFGWESEVQLIIEIDGFDNIIGDFDFFTANTDLIEYFSCKIVQNKKQALIKKRSDVTVDMFATKDLDDNDIEPILTENILIKSKPIKSISKWETASIFEGTIGLNVGVLNDKTVQYALNPAASLTSYDISDSYAVFQQLTQKYNDVSSIRNVIANDFVIVEAKDNLTDITIDVSNLDFNLSSTGDGYTEVTLELRYGNDYYTAENIILFNEVVNNESFSNTNSYSHSVPFLNRGDKIWLYYYLKVRVSNSLGGDVFSNITVNSMDVSVEAISTSYNTIAPSSRLYDVCEQTVKSISQLPISFPFAEINGEMYNQRVLSGNMLRNVIDKPFYISMKDIEDWLPEIYGDYEVSETGVYFGLYDDYYRNEECGVFDTVKFDDYEKAFNKKYAINQFNYKYKKYQSQKENTVENTYDVIHGETEWLVGNVFVENKKESEVGFVRDAFLIAETQKKALTESDSTTTQDDDTIFIIDTIESEADYVFTETDFLQHVYNEQNSLLEINNTGTFSFVLIGITVGTTFKILGGDSNAGTYTVTEVTNRKLSLSGTNASKNNNGERITQFEYIVTKETAPYRTWGNENFSIISGLLNRDDYANLKYSVKRNIVRFYNQYLATCNLYSKKEIKNTYYKNNPDAILSYDGLTTTEGESFTPTNPILSPYTHNITLITDFATYKTLENKIRDKRGYIRVVDKEDFVLKLYPMEMTYVNSSELGELTIKGEEKYEQSLVNIAYNDLGYITINDYYRTSKINYKEKDEKFYIFDESNRLLYKPLFWNRISVNNTVATSKTQLIEWLTLIS